MRVTYVKTPFKSTVSFYNIFNSYGLIIIRFYRQYNFIYVANFGKFIYV